MTNHAGNLDGVFHALSDPTRRGIVSRLSRGPASVSDLHEPAQMAMPTLLQHIRVLEQSGLIGTEKVGRVRLCELKPKALSASEAWLGRQRAVWEARLDRMDAYVVDLHQKEKKNAKRKRKD
jgi:DNA-binding transcriptional ArsR family regulator